MSGNGNKWGSVLFQEELDVAGSQVLSVLLHPPSGVGSSEELHVRLATRTTRPRLLLQHHLRQLHRREELKPTTLLSHPHTNLPPQPTHLPNLPLCRGEGNAAAANRGPRAAPSAAHHTAPESAARHAAEAAHPAHSAAPKPPASCTSPQIPPPPSSLYISSSLSSPTSSRPVAPHRTAPRRSTAVPRARVAAEASSSAATASPPHL